MILTRGLGRGRGITLVELVIALTLLGLIAAAGTAIDFTSRMALIRGKKRVDVRGRASFAMEHMVRHIRLANEVSNGGASIHIWLDYNLSTSPYTPLNSADPNDDYEAKYEVVSKKLRYGYKWVGSGVWNWEDIATDVDSCSFAISSNPSNVTISITLTSGAESVSLESTVSLWCKGNI